jgi:SAM-dependent methyltransferase
MLRRLARKLLPRLKHPLLDAELTVLPRDEANARAYREYEPDSDPFVAARYDEGRRWRHVLAAYTTGRVLDVGAGNGAIELALAADQRFSVVSVETMWNESARRMRLRRVIADATALPFRDGAFDAVLSLETIEHLVHPREAGAETCRVLRDRGVILLTTPPKWRYAFRRDPHFGIRGLVAMPPSLQRRIAASHGFREGHHYVDRIYRSVPQIARLFPCARVRDVLARSRAPRRWYWDAVVLETKYSFPEMSVQ